jgi:hypothetical protein
MAVTEPIAKMVSTATFDGEPLVAVGEDFETRWAAWVARGRVHERRVRHRFVVSAAVIAVGTAIAFAFLA